jgi:small-conductance mechanosensitive channel
MAAVSASFTRFAGELIAAAPQFLLALVEAIVIVTLVVFAGRRMQAAWRSGRLGKSMNANLGILIGRVSYLVAIALGVIWIAYIFGIQLTGLLTFLGAVSLAVTFAIQDVLKNLVAGMYLLWEQPFVIGDAIKVKDVSGSVEDIRVRTTMLRAENGQLVMVPNAVLFTEIVINRRLEMPDPEATVPAP